MPKYMESTKLMQDELGKTSLKLEAITSHGVSTDRLEKVLEKTWGDMSTRLGELQNQVQAQISAQIASAPSTSSPGSTTQRKKPFGVPQERHFHRAPHWRQDICRRNRMVQNDNALNRGCHSRITPNLKESHGANC